MYILAVQNPFSGQQQYAEHVTADPRHAMALTTDINHAHQYETAEAAAPILGRLAKAFGNVTLLTVAQAAQAHQTLAENARAAGEPAIAAQWQALADMRVRWAD